MGCASVCARAVSSSSCSFFSPSWRPAFSAVSWLPGGGAAAASLQGNGGKRGGAGGGGGYRDDEDDDDDDEDGGRGPGAPYSESQSRVAPAWLKDARPSAFVRLCVVPLLSCVSLWPVFPSLSLSSSLSPLSRSLSLSLALSL